MERESSINLNRVFSFVGQLTNPVKSFRVAFIRDEIRREAGE